MPNDESDSSGGGPGTYYEFEYHGSVQKYFRRNRQFAERWESLTESLSESPYAASNVTHLKGPLHCSYRKQIGDYRVIYDVDDTAMVIRVYEAGRRGGMYRQRG